ncbi:hypothetical protein ACFWN7_11670 [Agromyces sp. NPDC058484]|uniref:hypothetical protein n=1 Tax=Agromyces sp. NPDC058484 TaxID=3346524 RepID=UPI0036508481
MKFALIFAKISHSRTGSPCKLLRFRSSRDLQTVAVQRVIAEIATFLDERSKRASTIESPVWLRQLVSLWDAERAAVLTFNYDTLLERAVNGSTPVTGAGSDSLQLVLGDRVVFPAPPATQPQFAGDAGAPHTADSFQVLKLHGSLAWYWAGWRFERL